MAFSDASISDLQAVQEATDLFVRWTSSAPEGTVFQVYVSGHLAWHGTARRAVVAAPPRGTLARIQVGTVAADEATTDFSATFTPTDDRARLSWRGGSYLDPTGGDDVAGFRVYGSAAAGGAVDYGTVLATVAAYPGGILADGFGLGGFGLGGFGRAASDYSWTSARLGSGTWQFDVRPFDWAGNEDTATSPVSVAIMTRPRPPAESSAGVRLTYTYDAGTGVATLAWLASPG